MYDLQTMRALCRPGKRRKGLYLAKNVIRSLLAERRTMNSMGIGPDDALSRIQGVVMQLANNNLTKALQEMDSSGEQQLFAPR
jgi:hypothetical protein